MQKIIIGMLMTVLVLLTFSSIAYCGKHYKLDKEGCVSIYDDNNWKIKTLAPTCNSKNKEMRIVDNKIWVKTRNTVTVYNKKGNSILSYPTPNSGDWVDPDRVAE